MHFNLLDSNEGDAYSNLRYVQPRKMGIEKGIITNHKIGFFFFLNEFATLFHYLKALRRKKMNFMSN